MLHDALHTTHVLALTVRFLLRVFILDTILSTRNVLCYGSKAGREGQTAPHREISTAMSLCPKTSGDLDSLSSPALLTG